jgi:hypothetical protein
LNIRCNSWDTAFCKEGASADPCDESYCGKAAFSEPCSKAMSQLIAKEKKIAAYFALHSHVQMWMYPWGYTKTLPPNSALLVLIFYQSFTFLLVYFELVLYQLSGWFSCFYSVSIWFK